MTRVMGATQPCRVCWGNGSVCKACGASGMQPNSRPAHLPVVEVQLSPLKLAELKLEAIEHGTGGGLSANDARLIRIELTARQALLAIKQHDLDKALYDLAQAVQYMRAAQRAEARARERQSSVRKA